MALSCHIHKRGGYIFSVVIHTGHINYCVSFLNLHSLALMPIIWCTIVYWNLLILVETVEAYSFWKLFRSVSASMSWFDSSSYYFSFKQSVNCADCDMKVLHAYLLGLTALHSLSSMGGVVIHGVLWTTSISREWYCTDNVIILIKVRSDTVFGRTLVIKYYFSVCFC